MPFSTSIDFHLCPDCWNDPIIPSFLSASPHSRPTFHSLKQKKSRLCFFLRLLHRVNVHTRTFSNLTLRSIGQRCYVISSEVGGALAANRPIALSLSFFFFTEPRGTKPFFFFFLPLIKQQRLVSSAAKGTQMRMSSSAVQEGESRVEARVAHQCFHWTPHS